MMEKTNINWTVMSDTSILEAIGHYIKQVRLDRNMTQADLARNSGLNRSTLVQIESGESITLLSLIQILRALDKLDILKVFTFSERISPIELAKIQKRKRQRARPAKDSSKPDNEPGW